MGTLRRWLIRLLGWLIAATASLTAVLLLAFAAYILFFDYSEHLKSWMESEATRVLGRRVRIDSFYVYLPNTFEMRGVSAEPREPGRPWLEFKSLRGELKLTGMLEQRVELRLLQVDGLVLRVQDYGGGRVDLPGLGRTDTERSSNVLPIGLAVSADRVVVNDATLIYRNHNLPWRLQASQLSTRLERDPAQVYRGRLAFQEGRLQIKDRPAFTGSVEARLELMGGEIRVADFKAAGEFFEIQAAGKVSFAREPEAQMRLEVQSRVGPAARSVLGLPQLTDAGSRPAKLHGTLSIGRGWHLLRGALEVPEARFSGVPLRGWRGNVYWDRSILELSAAEGWLAGGKSHLEVRQELPVAGHPAQVRGDLEQGSLRVLAESLTGESVPLESSVLGKVDLSIPLESPHRLSGEILLSGKPSSDEGERGVEFSATCKLEQGSLFLEPSHFQAGTVSLALGGKYPLSGSAELALRLDAGDLAEADHLQQLFRTLLHAEPARRLGMGGTGRVVGTVTGRLPAMTIEGSFSGSDVLFRGTRLGNVEASGLLRADAVRLEWFQARKNDAAISGRGEVTFDTLPPSHWALAGTIRDWDVSDFVTLVPIPAGLRGSLSVTGRVRSRDQQLVGEGDLSLSEPSLFGMLFDRALARAELEGRRIRLESVSLSRGNALVEGRLELDADSAGLAGEFRARGVPLSVIGPDRLDLRGEASAELRLSGTVESPSIQMTASAPQISVEETALGEGRFEARVENGEARGTLSLRGPGFELDGRSIVSLSAGYPATGQLRWRGADLAPWLRAIRSELPRSLRLLSDGEASFAGPLSRPASFAAEATMSGVSTEMGGYRLDSEGPMHVRLRDRAIAIDGLGLTGEGTHVQLAGEIPLDDGDWDLETRGAVNLNILQGFYPSVASAGGVDLSARLGGSWRRPILSGSADVKSGVFRVYGFPHALADVEGRVFFDNRTVRFPELRARFGGRPAQISGTLMLSGLRPESFELRANGRAMRLRYPRGLVATLDADLRLSGTPSSPMLSGRIDVREATWTREYDLATGILVRRDSDRLDLLEEVDRMGPLANLRFDIDVVAPQALKVRNSRATIDAEARLQLRGTFARPALLGRATARRGELFLLGQRYELVSGRVEFIDPGSVKPFFDIVAESRVKSYRVELRLSGTPDRFFPELSSDPPLRTVDILRLLAGAPEREILIGSEEEEIAGVGVASLLTERLTQEVGRRAERLFGLDRFSIDPFLVGQFANPTARVSIGKQIYRDLSVNYSSNLNAATETLILIEYTPEGPITWIFSRDEEGAFGVDLRFRKSF